MDERLYDVIVVGGGPAGLTAALYLARAKYRVLVLEKQCFGGQIAITEEVVNYPGIPSVSGSALTQTMKAQAESFGAEFALEEAVRLDVAAQIKTVTTTGGEYCCLGLLLATGAKPRTVGFAGEEQYKGRGVAYCATCDGEFFTGKDIFVVGGGYAAAEEGLFLTKFGRHVTILMRKNDFSCAASVADKVKRHEKITVLNNTVLEEVSGENGLNYARYRNTLTGQVTEHRAPAGDYFGVFVFAGYAPDTQMLQGVIERSEDGYIITDASRRTSVEGVYAAGDVCIKPLRQVVTATGDGALAATELEKYVSQIQAKTGLRAQRPEPQPRQQPMLAQEMRQQLAPLFERMQTPMVLRLYLDQSPVSKELETFAQELAAVSRKLSVEKGEGTEQFCPCVRIFRADGADTGLAFHGVPGGHEFTSFVLGIYNAAGPGQEIEQSLLQKIRTVERPVDIKVLVTLSCDQCPDLVAAAQQLAAHNAHIRCEVFDIAHFPSLRERYRVMSVPCMVIDEEKVSFGRKNLPQILQLL